MMTEQDVPTVAFVGSVVPDIAEYITPAFSRAGNMFQENVLSALAAAGLPVSLVLSQQAMPAFPGSRKLRVRQRTAALAGGLPVQLMPFINLPAVRPLCVGIVLMLRLLSWAFSNSRQPRIILTYNVSEPAGLFTLLAARLTGSRAIAMVNDINVPGQTVPRTVLRRIDFFLHRWLLPRFDGLTVVNETIASDFGLRKSRWIRLEGAVTAETLDRLLECSLGSGDEFVIVAAGSLDPHNGIGVILDAFRELVGNYRLIIAGEGPLAGEVCAAAAQDSRIEFRGGVTFDEVLELYRRAHLLLNVRLTHSIHTRYFFPSKLFELLASGVPVITTCTGHVEAEYAGFTFLLREETPLGLAELIRRVRSTPPEQRNARGAAARAYVIENLTWAAQGRRMRKLIEAVAAGACHTPQPLAISAATD